MTSLSDLKSGATDMALVGMCAKGMPSMGIEIPCTAVSSYEKKRLNNEECDSLMWVTKMECDRPF